MGEVATFTAGRMSLVEYRRERERIGALLKGTQATAHADQELAGLFYRSGWRQEDLAQEERKSRPYITRRLLFGRFLADVPIGTNPEFATIRASLTEGKFRAFWELTEGKSDGPRFVAVRRMLLEARDRYGYRRGLAETVVNVCGDAEWHRITTITRRVQEVDQEATEAEITTMLDGMVKAKGRQYGAFVSRRTGVASNYRIERITQPQWIELSLLMGKLAPLLQGLKEEGGKNHVTCSPGTVAKYAHDIEQLVEELASQQPHRGAASQE